MKTMEFYQGPTTSWNNVECGVELEELGVSVMIAASTVAGAGRGVYVVVNEGVEETFLEKGTVLTGYSKGTFEVSKKMAVELRTYFSIQVCGSMGC